MDSNVAWTASTESWITLSPSSGSGDENITVSIDYSAAPVGDTTITLDVAATGSSLSANRQLLVDNGIDFSPQTLGLSKIWGAYQTSEIHVMTHLPWTISTDLAGVSFEPSSGNGDQAVQISYNQAQFDVGGNYQGTVTLVSGDLQESLPISITMNAPVPLYNHDGAELGYTKSTFSNSNQQQLALSFENQAIVPWQLSSLPGCKPLRPLATPRISTCLFRSRARHLQMVFTTIRCNWISIFPAHRSAGI